MKCLKKIRINKSKGYILRQKSSLRRVIEGVIEGKNTVGRPLLENLQQNEAK